MEGGRGGRFNDQEYSGEDEEAEYRNRLDKRARI